MCISFMCKVVNLHYVNVALPFINTWVANIANTWIWLPCTNVAPPITQRVGVKHCKRMASLYKHTVNTSGSITLILRCE